MVEGIYVKQILTVSGKYDTVFIFTDDIHYYVYNERNNLVAEVYENYEDAKEAAMFIAGQKGDYMVYKVIVNWYNDLSEKEETNGLFLIADSYSDAVDKIVKYYGEEDLNEFKIALWLPDDFIRFDLDNPDEDWLFNKVNSDIGKNVIWQNLVEWKGLKFTYKCN